MSSNERNLPVADAILARLLRDIRGRSGLGDEWSNIDVDVRNEIIAAWRGLISEEVRASNAPETGGYAGDSLARLLTDMEAAAKAARTNARDGVAVFVRQWVERLRALSSETRAKSGFEEAFWQIAEVLDLPAMPISPKQAFETVMLPKIREATDTVRRVTACLEPHERYGVCVKYGHTEEFWAALAAAFAQKTNSPQCDTKCFDWPRCECGRRMP